MSNKGKRHYPMLEPCRIVLRSATTGGGKPPVRLTEDCLTAAKKELPQIYDFALEHEVLEKKEDRHREQASLASTSREELQENILVRMKSVTKASEPVCIALLEENDYNLKTSIEAFFQS